jgi:hypothetical protein
VDGSRLHSGEILCNLVQVQQQIESIEKDIEKAATLVETVHPFVVVLTQDCDLEWDFDARSKGEASLSRLKNVLFGEAVETIQFRQSLPPGKDIWKRIIQNKDERYHCLEAVPADVDAVSTGIPSIAIDFKRYFTISTDEVYKRIAIAQATRRSRLITPYAEHLASRFFYFQLRIATPRNHDVQL